MTRASISSSHDGRPFTASCDGISVPFSPVSPALARIQLGQHEHHTTLQTLSASLHQHDPKAWGSGP